MRRSRWVACVALLAALVLLAAGCGGRQPETGQQSKRITIGYIAWDEAIAVSNLYEVVLERRGYQVQLTELEAGPTYAGLAKGDVDLFLDSWLPQTHADYWAQYHDRLEDLGVWYDRATLNIAVPDYLVDVNSIEDLRGRAAEFGGTITGIDPGAGLSRVTRDQMIPQYGLDGQYTLQTSSTTAMLASLQRAVDAQRPIVVTLWHPHWAYAKFPIKDLADPRGAMGAAEQIHAVGRKGFTADFPEVTGMVRKFHLDDGQLASLENEVNAAPKGQEKAAAARWADAHPEVIASFTG
ncbi:MULTISPECIES: glycine betaine ABC transporter substrate-binding protein [unclassified Saccharopolyspora]|uniref:glycine betaine ABC transporter substrate-binding protein n=1 Tax=unclassified Saccharopolyspora TaxID=2646250 RepID=UPI001CD7D145|nr:MULTISPECIES: glycine betaine ABC transporter substrate-binding protein [unclassified Saccharopolyspora]MCA1187700.1 glycine betaine ABC transporter substrate-binding protein [Saccharopolyspora sp. 6T]MCA1281149.1 glycine betaine ABC transporter substrate-binding protein [Saccharopolyspora sp. 7B]